jgi:hypothetical protein
VEEIEMGRIVTAYKFEEKWEAACNQRQSLLYKYWNDRKKYTSCIVNDENSIIDLIAESIGLLCYSGYYHTDAIFFEEKDRVPDVPKGQTWVRRIRIAFEHENVFNKRLYEEVSHLLLIDCDLRVLVTYPDLIEGSNAILDYLHDVVSGSNRAALIADNKALLLILGVKDTKENVINWGGYVYTMMAWQKI